MSNLTTESTFAKSMEKRLERLDREFERLEVRAENASREVKRGFEDVRARFAEGRIELRERLDRARDAGESVGSELQESVEAAWNDLSDAFNRARTKITGM